MASFASVPLLHGLGDERTKLVVDGMTVSSSCPNHMNPPLSYVAPSQTAQVTVMAGITPVSLGGDSLGGTVSVESRAPVFAKAGERLHEEDASTGFYRATDRTMAVRCRSGSPAAIWASATPASWADNDDYTDGSGHKVTSTYAQTTDHTVTLAAAGRGQF